MQYSGEWYLDKPHGKGMLIYPDGSILKGHFAGGLSEGCFTYYSVDGHVELQDFKGGCLIKTRLLHKAGDGRGMLFIGILPRKNLLYLDDTLRGHQRTSEGRLSRTFLHARPVDCRDMQCLQNFFIVFSVFVLCLFEGQSW